MGLKFFNKMMILIFSLYEFYLYVKIIFLQLNTWLSAQVKPAAICKAPLSQKLVMGFSNFSQERRASSLSDQLTDSLRIMIISITTISSNGANRH